MFSATKFFCSFCILGGLNASVCLLTSSRTELRKKPSQTIKLKRRKKWEDYKQDCYKWIFYDTKMPGELVACIDKEASGKGSSSLIFVLGWKQAEGMRNLLVDSIQFDGADQISFQFAHPTRIGNLKDVKLPIPPQKPALKNNLNNLNGKILKNICKMENSKLSCDDGKYKADTRSITWYF